MEYLLLFHVSSDYTKAPQRYVYIYIVCLVKSCPYIIDILIYRVIQQDGLNFVSLYFKIRTSDKYDINYI